MIIVEGDFKMKCLLLCSVFLLSGALFSANAYADEAWTAYRSIESIATENGDTIFVLSGSKMVGSSSCTNKFRIDANDPMGGGALSVLNNANTSGKSIRVNYLNSTTACAVLVMQLQVEPS